MFSLGWSGRCTGRHTIWYVVACAWTREQGEAALTVPLCPARPRSGMFKWMISGHKGSKQKQEKLNNASAAATINNNNKNKNNLRQQQQQAEAEDEEAQQLHQNNANGSVLHIPDAAELTYNNNSTSNLHKSSGSSTPEHRHYNQHQHHQQQHTQKHGDVNQNTDNLIQSASG